MLWETYAFSTNGNLVYETVQLSCLKPNDHCVSHLNYATKAPNRRNKMRNSGGNKEHSKQDHDISSILSITMTKRLWNMLQTKIIDKPLSKTSMHA